MQNVLSIILLLLLSCACGVNKQGVSVKKSTYKISDCKQDFERLSDSVLLLGQVYDGDLSIPPMFETEIWLNDSKIPHTTNPEGKFRLLAPAGVNKLLFYNSNDSQLFIDSLFFESGCIFEFEIRLGYNRIR